ncbi:interleukin-10 receptor subunit alpha [Esox lucius]|uniref:Fibronectin type-III domain-containing protein n=1 Tax=Esox lucius TaxID=8010 RepID=A0A3P9A1K7_ESOLU|nr:interleukin-10 receptor subunit alpha [Esox lucius]
MDWTFWISVLAHLIISDYASGLKQQNLFNLTVEVWDGEVMLLWQPPKEAPSPAQYRVQMERYGATNWKNVTSCGNTQETHCDLTRYIEDPKQLYKVRVGLITENGNLTWSTPKRFNPKDTQLLIPSSTVLLTSTSVIVRVYRKPLLKRIYPFGLLYTVHLQERGLQNKTTVWTFTMDGDEDEAEVLFRSLHWGEEYCVSLRVEGSGGRSSSKFSPAECFFLPEQEWFIMAIVSFSILSVTVVLLVLALGTFFFLWRPRKMPASLKSLNSGWHPLSVGEVPVEIVTDKGWFISKTTTDAMDWVANDMTMPAVTEDQKEEMDRKMSLDSGVSTKSHISIRNKGSSARQEDSGCGSLGAPESVVSSSSGTEESTLRDGRTNGDMGLTEDSGMGMGCRSGSAVSLHGEDCGHLAERLLMTGDCYRSQSPSSVDAHVTENETVTCDSAPGYRSGHLACICLGAGQCLWCQAVRHYKSRVDGQSVACSNFPEEQLIGGNLTGDTCEMESTFFCYKKNRLDIETLGHLEGPLLTCTDESFPLLTALSKCPLGEEGLDWGVKTISLSLGDLKVTFD